MAGSVHHYHNIDLGLPRGAIMRLDCFEMEAVEDRRKWYRLGAILHIPNVRSQLRSDNHALELIWSDLGNPTKNFKKKRMTVIDTDDERAITIER
jgi:hypothetical protein